MICEQCKQEGKTSKIYPGWASVTDMYCPPFYDEQGQFHDHDMNTITTSYTCSNKHSFDKKSVRNCWCGWPNET